MKTLTQLALIALMLAGAYQASGQFTLDGQLRPRSEYRHGYKSLADTAQDPAFFTSQRTRLNVGYEHEQVRMKVVFQDIRTWGSEKQLNVSDNNFSIHEAWGEILFTDELSFKVGRQELVYDDHRILGSVNWAQQARSHDIALLKFTDSLYQVHAGAAYNQDKPKLASNFYANGGNYKAMQFVWLNRNAGGLNTSLLFMNNGMPVSTVDSTGVKSQSINYSQTSGARVAYSGEKFGINGAFYYQSGKDPADQELKAFDAMGSVSYALSEVFKVTAGYEYLSGTDQVDPPTDENNSFTPFYGTNHKFNGFMDHFYVGNHGNSVGLSDAYFKVGAKKENFSVGLDAHYFMAAADILDGEQFAQTGEMTSMDPALGWEFDLSLGYSLSDKVSIKAGYSHMLPTESLVMLEGGSTNVTQNWGYLMVNFAPKFMNTPKSEL